MAWLVELEECYRVCEELGAKLETKGKSGREIRRWVKECRRKCRIEERPKMVLYGDEIQF